MRDDCDDGCDGALSISDGSDLTLARSSNSIALLSTRYLAQDFEPHFGPTLPLGCCDHEHTTSFAVASLFLIDRRPLYPLTAFEALQDNTSMWEGWLSDTPAQGGWYARRFSFL